MWRQIGKRRACCVYDRLNGSRSSSRCPLSALRRQRPGSVELAPRRTRGLRAENGHRARSRPQIGPQSRTRIAASPQTRSTSCSLAMGDRCRTRARPFRCAVSRVIDRKDRGATRARGEATNRVCSAALSAVSIALGGHSRLRDLRHDSSTVTASPIARRSALICAADSPNRVGCTRFVSTTNQRLFGTSSQIDVPVKPV